MKTNSDSENCAAKKLIALYAEPEDRDAFLRHYEDVHAPLVRAVPGLTKLVANRVMAAPLGGTPPYFLIAEMHFADDAAFDLAMKSPENRAAGKDLTTFARDRVTLLVVDDA